MDRRFDASEWRNECHPITLPVIPAATSAGLMILVNTMSGVKGFLPFRRIDGNRKSSSSQYGDSLLQFARTAQTKAFSGTGFRLAGVFTSPKWLRTTPRVTDTCMVTR